jgi:WD40 repeat protein
MGPATVKDPPEPPATQPQPSRLRRRLEAVGLSPASPDGNLYHGFISYSHAADGRLAPALQKGLQRFAKPWYRTRALHIFRDEASLAANPHLWSSIRESLDHSQFFILLASPDAASSPWVSREAETWRQTKPSEHLLVGLTEGELVWDQQSQDFDWRRTNALPETLRGAFTEEPRYIDLRWARNYKDLALSHPRFRDAIAELAAPLHGKPKDELASEEVSQHRRTLRLARGAVTALASLLVIAVIATVVALNQRSTAIREANVAAARQLAATSESELSTNLDVALLLAVKAYRKDPNPQTRSALLRADTASPHLVRYVALPGQIAQLAGGGDGRTAVAGLADGRVLRWAVARPVPTEVGKLPGQIASLSLSRDGSAIAASDGARAILWRQGRAPLTLTVPAGQKADVVALSPSGATAVVHGAAARFGNTGSITTVDVADGASRSVHPDSTGSTDAIIVPSDDQVLLFNTGYGAWERRRLTDWSREAGSSAQLGAHEQAGQPSSDGRRFTATNGAPTIPVWSTRGTTNHDHPGLTAQAPISTPTSIALSPNGTRLAVADSGTVYVAPVAGEGAPRRATVELTGKGSVNSDGVRFLGDGSHLLAASRDEVAIWNLNQLDRLARTRPTPVQPACNGCAGAQIAVSPDGSRAAIVDGSGNGAVIQPLTGRSGRPVTLQSGLFSYTFDTPVWERSGAHVALPVSPAAGGRNVSPPTGSPPVARVWAAGNGTDPPAAVGLSGDGRSVHVIDARGHIYTQDVTSGALRSSTAGPGALVEGTNARYIAAVRSSPDLMAAEYGHSVTITDLRSRRSVGRIPGSDVSFLVFAGHHLLVQRKSGDVEVWRERGQSRQRVLPGDASYFWAPVPNSQGTLVARQRSDSSIVLDDLTTGTVLGTLTSPGNAALKTGVAFSPDGSRLITVTDNPSLGPATLVERDLSDEALVRDACAAAGRSLTAAEWRTFVGTKPPRDLRCG